MSLLVEDGSGVVGAVSLVGEDYLIDYLSSRGLDYDSTESSVWKGILVRASDYLTFAYASRLAGLPLKDEQFLVFPRKYLTSDGWVSQGLPDKVKRAVCEVCLLLQGGENLFKDDSLTGQGINKLSVGVLSIEASPIDQVKTSSGTRLFPQVESLMRGFLDPDTANNCGFQVKVLKRF